LRPRTADNHNLTTVKFAVYVVSIIDNSSNVLKENSNIGVGTNIGSRSDQNEHLPKLNKNAGAVIGFIKFASFFILLNLPIYGEMGRVRFKKTGSN